MSSPLAGKVYAITGGASGIGLATAKLLSGRGATVCIADVDGEAMKSAEAHFSGLPGGVKYDVARVDVSRRAEVDAWIEGIVERHGRLDGAANVAGIIGREHGRTSTTDLRDEEWDRIIAVNLTGTMYCLRAELRNIVDGGSIVNTSSIHGLKGELVYPRRAVGGVRGGTANEADNARVRQSCRLRCEQTWCDWTHARGGAGERAPGSAGQCCRAGCDLHAPDAEKLGSDGQAGGCAIRRPQCVPETGHGGGDC